MRQATPTNILDAAMTQPAPAPTFDLAAALAGPAPLAAPLRYDWIWYESADDMRSAWEKEQPVTEVTP